MKKGFLLLTSMLALGLYINKSHPEVKMKIMKPFKKMLHKMGM